MFVKYRIRTFCEVDHLMVSALVVTLQNTVLSSELVASESRSALGGELDA